MENQIDLDNDEIIVSYKAIYSSIDNLQTTEKIAVLQKLLRSLMVDPNFQSLNHFPNRQKSIALTKCCLDTLYDTVSNFFF